MLPAHLLHRGFVGADCRAAVTEAALECVSEAVESAGADSPDFTDADLEVSKARCRKYGSVRGMFVTNCCAATNQLQIGLVQLAYSGFALQIWVVG